MIGQPGLDTRPWNLVAGLALLAGCGSRTIGAEEAADTQTSEAEAPETSESPECVSDADCPSYYYCYSGMCEYAPHHDGHLDHYDDGWYYDCYEDEECGPLEVCYFNYCEQVPVPTQCGVTFDEQPAVLTIPGGGLALSFVDVDEDGAEELVVASSDALHVFESGSDVATSSPNEMAWSAPVGLAGGQFDGMPGEDVMVAVQGDTLALHASDGVGSFGPAVVNPSPIPGLTGIESGDFDGVPPTDVFVWGEGGAGVVGSFNLSMLDVQDASVRDVAALVSGLAIYRDTALEFYDLGGAPLGSPSSYGVSPHRLTPAAGGAYDLSSGTVGFGVDAWSMLQLWDPLTSNEMNRWGFPGVVQHMRSADLLGDGFAEVALIVDDGVGDRLWVHLDLFGPGECVVEALVDGVPTALAAGDHDGDGDQELAVMLASGVVLVFDGEG